jgi:type I restriction enzyme M protein
MTVATLPQTYTIVDILKDSNYKLGQFKDEDIKDLETRITFRETKKGSVAQVVCLVRGKLIDLKAEEVVRQLYLKRLMRDYGYGEKRLALEHPIYFGREKKRADIVVLDKDRPDTPYIIIEIKAVKAKDGKAQLKSYTNATGASMAVWTNGDSISYYHRKDPNYFEDITDIPNVSQTLSDILNEKFTIEDLVKKDKLVTEKKSLKQVIEDLEDEVLANAGVDVFEEVFKLIFTKLYDEWRGGQDKKRTLEFRNTGQTDSELRQKIQKVFDKAKEKWEGIFEEGERITLSPSHLAICVGSLQDIKLFNSNLDVIDEAFEYLINKTSKGEKGQYFTSRYVIDMCVKMLNPQEHETMIDTAAGSSGFPVHVIFHVWRQILEREGYNASHLFTIEDKPLACKEYVQEKVFAIDFDEKAVRVGRTLNLIAGDGQTNVLHLNTLDYERWDEVIEDEEWRDTYNEGFKRLKKLRVSKDSYRNFSFDILMANPPFAGDIKEQRILLRYDVAQPGGKTPKAVGRDILFIERNLDFLKPGGRMAVVLPQGRFNNATDKYIRDYLAERCRILAVVGLHGNTFKPHTGTKTSVLFVQKWNEDEEVGALCPRVDDYNIFFATMRKTGKDNSGEKIYVRDPETNEVILDEHGHLIVDHDLFNHEGKTADGIAEAFIEFAKKERLSFFA